MAESHIPINHPLRPFYRFLVTWPGLYVLIFGIVAFSRTRNFQRVQPKREPACLGARTPGEPRLRDHLDHSAGAVVLVSAVDRPELRSLGATSSVALALYGGRPRCRCCCSRRTRTLVVLGRELRRVIHHRHRALRGRPVRQGRHRLSRPTPSKPRRRGSPARQPLTRHQNPAQVPGVSPSASTACRPH